MERLWSSPKYEEIYLQEYDSAEALRKGLKGYFDFYTFKRPHPSLGGRTPAEVYFGPDSIQGLAAYTKPDSILF